MKKTILIAAVLAIIVLIAISPVRKSQARREVDAFAQEHPVSISFTVSEEITDRKAFAEELVRLARWEEKTKEQIDQIYKSYIPGNPERVKDMGMITGYQGRAGLEKEMRAAKWKELRTGLEEETLAGLESIYRNAGDPAPQIPEYNAVRVYYQRDRFSRLCKAISLAEEGDPAEVYMDRKPGWNYSAGDGDEWACPDLLYLLWPEEVRHGYENRIQEAMDSVNKSDLEVSVRNVDRAVSDADGLQKRYGCIVSNLEEGEKLLADLRQEYREKAAEAEEARKQRIQEQLDQIYSSQNSYYSDPIDPDDYDIEGYYDDYRDEYDDEDDAYEGFLDDEDIWDDY